MRLRPIARGAMLVLVVCISAAIVVPWKQMVEKQIARALAKQGISPASVKIDRIGVHGLVLKDVSLGDPPVLLSTLTLAYQWRALLDGRIEDVALNGLALHAIKTEENSAWQIEGLENLLRSKATDAPAAIPVTRAALASVPISSLAVTDSRINVVGGGIIAEIPIALTLQHKAETTLAVQSSAATIAMGENTVAIKQLALALALDDAKQQWNGTWKIDSIVVITEAINLPPLKANGTITVLKDKLLLTGNAVSGDKSYNADFTLTYALNDPTASIVVLKRLSMPFNGGKLATRNIRFPLDGKKHSTNFTLSLSNIAVDTLMQALTNNRATASGIVSGTVPVTITAGGEVRIGNGSLKAQGPGTIALAPEVIPGDNAQVALVRDVMKNLQYTVLALEFGMAPDNSLTAKLAVEGNNPDVEQGRPIKLTVNLSGDLLDLIKQNVTLMTDPKTFIEQKQNGKNQ